MTHTAGPWRIERERGSAIICAPGWTGLAEVVTHTNTIGDAALKSHPEGEANVLLIVAAPDLLAALRATVSAMEIQERRDAGEFHLSMLAMRCIWDKALADARIALGNAS